MSAHMAYRSVLGNLFKTEVKKVRNPEYVQRIQDECAIVRTSPLDETEPLTGNLAVHGFRYRKIKDTDPEYRILIKTLDCGFYLDQEAPNCEHQVCPVGLDETYLDKIENDLSSREKWLGFDSSTEPSTNAQCTGLIKFAMFGPRELFNNLYKLPKDKLQLYAKM